MGVEIFDRFGGCNCAIGCSGHELTDCFCAIIAGDKYAFDIRMTVFSTNNITGLVELDLLSEFFGFRLTSDRDE